MDLRVRMLAIAMLCVIATGCSRLKTAPRSPGTGDGASNPEFELPIEPGSRLRVHLKSGASIEGRLVEVTGEAIELSVRASADSTMSIPRGDVAGWEAVSGDTVLLVLTFVVTVIAVVSYALGQGGF